MPNVFDLPDRPLSQEQFDVLMAAGAVKIERILSSGHTTPTGEWYDQEQDEWVILLQGRATLSYADGSEADLHPGDYLYLPAHCRHRVEFTSTDPPCVWLAVHYPAQTSCP
ncbi:cupin domain-containing protein [Trichothermofontia sp.]